MDDLQSSTLREVPFAECFFQFAIPDKALVSANTATDKQLPLMKSGELFGTFCHDDFVAQAIDDEQFAFLQNATGELPKFL